MATKNIVIGLIVIAVIGVGAYAYSSTRSSNDVMTKEDSMMKDDAMATSSDAMMKGDAMMEASGTVDVMMQ